ncbi:DUF1659 domain-containing protein [Megasphaera vaginalis (ex Bordigoni et al. 2020)]|uniref:DUF1659 domain-containing protein n=1 Tax=Megasphaera vaginalis (ex Bordigoni et al. 2020) TaxID=2045301 RepID=UPI000C7CE536|nr:DUF1659 domain-containing protein [Megasphaera vaginalis (ex Bordigoni et al. 2020)]
MANRVPVSSKLKLVVSYVDEASKERKRELSFRDLKAGSEPAAIAAASAALAGLQEDTLTTVKEVVENVIEM